MPPILYLIDGHALAYRTYFALTAANPSGDRWVTKSGEPTAGVYGFTSVLMRILEQEHPDYLAVAFDTGKTFRDELFAAYKGTRAKMPEDLRIQIERIRQLVDAFRIPRLEVEGFEADDVLGSIARQAAEQGLGVKIITGDRDLLQLVTDRVMVNLASIKLADAKDYLPDDVEAALGVRPEQVVDYKALVGDKSDNIPGVAGIGEKTAASMLKQYQTLDNIYAHLEEIPKGACARLEAGRDAAYLSRQLAEIKTDVSVTLDLEKARFGQFDLREVDEIFRELEFRSLVGRLSGLLNQGQPGRQAAGQQLTLFGEEAPVIGTPAPSTITTHIVNTPEGLHALVEALEAAPTIAFDTETTSTDALQGKLVGISLSIKEGEGYYIPIGHNGTEPNQLPVETVVEAIRGPMTDLKKAKLGHNLKYDWLVLARYGLEVSPLSFDTMIAEWLINPASRNLGLKNLAWTRLGTEMVHIEDLIGRGKGQITMAEVPMEMAAPYAAHDAEVTYDLIPSLESELEAQNAGRLFREIEMPLVTVLGEMEQAGVALDVPFLRQMSAELTQRMVEIERQIYDACGGSFNINSTQQLSVVLFERLKLEPPDRRKKTASGHFSTSADVLDELRGQHLVVDLILEYRELSKLKSTYLDALPERINPQTGRVHTSFNQTGTVTGRIASSDPNLQNIPTRNDLGRRVRQAFTAAPGNVLLSVDYSQIELRIVADMSGDETMLAAFRAGQDIHATTAAAVYGIPLEKVSKDQRRRAKGINFGLIYGMSAFGLTRYSDLTLAEAEDFVKAYFRQFPKVKSFLDGMRRTATDQGYVETLLGRRRYFPGLKMQANINVRNREEREAINAPVQGTAADIMKLAMLKVPNAIKLDGLSGRLLLQVHDELVLEVPEDELKQTARLVQTVMENAYKLSIPLDTDARCGYNWGEMTPLESFGK